MERDYYWRPAGETAERPLGYPASIEAVVQPALKVVHTWAAAVSIARMVANQVSATGRAGDRPATPAEITWAREHAGPL